MYKSCLLFFLLSFQTILLGQEQESLLRTITRLSQTYSVIFSYNSDEIDKIKKIDIRGISNLSEALESIEVQTGFKIEKVDAQNFIIILPKRKDMILVCGKVLNRNHSPIANIIVNSSTQITTTNTKGEFHLEILDQITKIVLSASGYKTKYLEVSFLKGSCKTILLEEITTQLDEVVIKDYITNGILKNENGSITVKIKETGSLPGVIEPDAIQTLQFIPGMQSPDETVTGLHIRGSTPDQNLILYDGVKMYQEAHFFGLLSAFNPYVIKEVQLFRSATKAKYGGHAGGVISIEVDKDIPKTFSADIATTLTHSSAAIKLPVFKNKMALFISARKGIGGFSNTITSKKYAEVAFQNTSIINAIGTSQEKGLSMSSHQFGFEDYYAKLIFQPYRCLQFNFGYIKNQNNLSFEGLSSFFKSNTNDNLKINSHTLYESISFDNESLGTHNLRLSTTSYTKKYSGFKDFDKNAQQPNLLEITSDKENFVKEISIQYVGEKKISKNGFLEFGYERNQSEVGYTADSYGLDSKTFREVFNGKETSQSFFSDLKFRNKKAQLNTGVRRQYFNRFHKVFWEPRSFINYKIFPRLRIKASHEIKHQSISQITDLRNDGLGKLFDRLWVVSTDKSIPIIINNQASIGLEFQQNGWTLDIEAYTKKLKGIGILLTDNIFEPKNVSGTDMIKGIDMLLKKQWKRYGTWLSYSFSESQNRFERINDNQSFDGSFDIPHSVVWTHTFSLNSFSFSLGYRFRNGIPYTQKRLDLNQPQSNFITFETYNGKRLPDYHRLDATIDYNFFLNKARNVKIKMGFSFQNLSNKRNILSRDFKVVESINSEGDAIFNEALFKKIDRISIGFTPNFIIRCSL